MRKVVIRTPIWATRSVGIALDKIGPEGCEVEITYKTKDGQRLYPGTFHVTREQADEAEKMRVKGVDVALIQIRDLEAANGRRRD